MNSLKAECVPLKSVDQVLQWKNYNLNWPKVVKLQGKVKYSAAGEGRICHTSILKPTSIFKSNSVPKTLVCHDMKGGYLDDRFIDGSLKSDSYRFFHWSGIDIFVYFSHHFLTIPPCGWINAAHIHGVKILGTLISEWTEGEAIWSKILHSESTVLTFADTLTSICKQFQFDGYLLNIENKIPDNKVPELEKFIKLLHTKLHKNIENAELIWYDSVTKEGNLKWQNELNSLNKNFFDLCDGIFLNYNWKPENLENSNANARERFLDVYVGIDVFGRKCYGNGGFKTSMALEVVRSKGLSAAIFAPGWVYEGFENVNLFIYREQCFWQKLWKYLYVHGPTNLPFETSFCQGFGKAIYVNGKLVRWTPWYNLMKQQHQVTEVSCCLNKYEYDSESRVDPVENPQFGCVEFCTETAFDGGGCLKFNLSKINQICRLLVCRFPLNGETIMSVATKKVNSAEAVLSLELLLENKRGSYRILKLWCSRKIQMKLPSKEKVLIPLETDEVMVPSKKVFNLYGYDLKRDYHGNDDGWEINHFLIDSYGFILEIAGLVHEGEIFLGFLGIYPVHHHSEDKGCKKRPFSSVDS